MISVNASEFLHAAIAYERARNSFYHDIFKALQTTTKGWESAIYDEIKIDQIGGAMTNLVFFASKPNGINKKLLVRIYGEGTDLFFPRDQEMKLFKILSSKQLGIGLLGEFNNGRVEQVIDGKTATASSIREPNNSAAIAYKMYELHQLVLPLDKSSTLLAKIWKFFNIAKEKCKLSSVFPTDELDFSALEREIRSFEAELQGTNSPVVFGHGDLQYGNVMIKENEAVLIDFEYAGYLPRGFDIGNHFCEWMANYHGSAPHLMDESRYPTVDEQNHFCRSYLERGQLPVTDEDVNALRLEANLYGNGSHILWALWSFIQLTQSEIDFDFLGYGRCRLHSFLSRNLKGDNR